jgi:hypothetical protein
MVAEMGIEKLLENVLLVSLTKEPQLISDGLVTVSTGKCVDLLTESLMKH